MNAANRIGPPLAPEASRLLANWNRTLVEFDAEKRIEDLFDEQAACTPDKTAVVFRDRSLTYAGLAEKAGALASCLRSLGVGPGTVVAVCVERSLEMMVALWGVLKAGGAYLPLDPEFPADRIALMLTDSRTPVILTQGHLRQRFGGCSATIIAVDEGLPGGPSRASAGSPSDAPRASDVGGLAYLIYTSGSTGTPKGVMVGHRNVVNFFVAMDRVIGAAPGVWLAVTSITFDISVLELLWTLTRGFTVVLQAEEEKLLSAGDYSVPQQLRIHNVTHLQCTPTLARIFARSPQTLSAMKSLRKLLLGGEALPVALVNQLSESLDCEIYNMYGPTETTVWSTSYKLARAERSIPIGKPIANTTLYILDERLNQVPIGEIGELYIGGAGVTAGYWKRPELTAERFLADHRSGDPEEVIYKTGDLARFRPDGNVEFIGRSDLQVKIRGFRIELGEIETVLGAHPGVQEVVVAAREDKTGTPLLAAYVIAKPGSGASARELQIYARQKLPDYMVPPVFTFLDRMPTTPNGKVDRKALPAPIPALGAGGEAAPASRTELENTIARIWQDALGLDAVGLNSNFFDLGATSLNIAEAAASILSELKRELRVTDLFAHPTVTSLAAFLSGHSDSQSADKGMERGAARREAMLKRQRRQSGAGSRDAD